MTETTLFENGGERNGTTPGADPGPARALGELSDGEEFTCALVVRERQLRQKKNGEDFLKLQLGDRTGAVPAIAWDRVSELFEACSPGAIVVVTGKFSVHPQFGRQIKLASARAAESHEYEADELAEGPAKPAELLESELRELLETIQNPSLRTLLDRFFGPETASWSRFREAPAAKHFHQAYAGGLLEHTLSVAQAVSAAANFFPGIDRDVAVTGALLHDIGKTEAYNDDPLAIDMTDAGRLQARSPSATTRSAARSRKSRASTPSRPRRCCTSSSPTTASSSTAPRSSPAPARRPWCTRWTTSAASSGASTGSRRSWATASWSRFDRGIESAAFFGARAA